MGIFSRKSGAAGFEYLDAGAVYLDSACQTLRPEEVIDAQTEYFHEYNSCGGRVKYAWGERLDEVIAGTRAGLLKHLGLRDSEYAAAFTLNTTYGINLVMSQLPKGVFSRIVTSDIEHNSVFLPSMTAAERYGLPRIVLSRKDSGELEYSREDLSGAVVILNVVSNIDGRELGNVRELARDVHAAGGILLLDGAQALAHPGEMLKGVDYDALFLSAHKAYGPSLGVVVIKKELLSRLSMSLLGGGTVSSVHKDSFELIPMEGEPHARLELGLQNFSGIAGFSAALDYLGRLDAGREKALASRLYDGLKSMPLTVLNTEARSIVSFYSERVDAHRLATFLSGADIMARSGYFCCHYYLQEVKKMPPLLRFSIGAWNNEEQIDKALSAVKKIITNI